jgi:hypothetical protein
VSGVTAKFKFEPGEHVSVRAFGIQADGRVTRCYLSKMSGQFYEVEFAWNGGFHNKDFFEDDLEAVARPAPKPSMRRCGVQKYYLRSRYHGR